MVGCVTDNASNFVAAFKYHGISVDEFENDYDADDDDDSDNEEDETDRSGRHVEFIKINDDIFPYHYRCAAHTLSRIGTKDASRALDNEMYKLRFNEAFAKLNGLCKKFNKPKSCELIKATLKSSLVMPCSTRWNSLFDSIKCLLKFDIEQLNSVCSALSLDDFSAIDIEFFKEYVPVMAPVAEGIDSLQGDTFYSFFLPILTRIKYKFESIATVSKLKHCKPLLKAIRDGFEKRFGHFFDLEDDRAIAAIVSACVHPYFKTRWLHKSLHSPENVNMIEMMILREAKKVSDEVEKRNADIKKEKEDENDSEESGM